MVEEQHPGLAALDAAAQVEPIARLAEQAIVGGPVGEQEARVGPVAPSPQREAAVATPGGELGAVEDDVDLGGEGDVPVDGVGAVPELDVGQGALVDDDHRLPIGADPVDGGVIDVAEHAVGVVLLPEVLLVDELDGEPQAVVPGMVLGRVPAEGHARRRAEGVDVGPLAVIGVVGPEVAHAGSHPS